MACVLKLRDGIDCFLLWLHLLLVQTSIVPPRGGTVTTHRILGDISWAAMESIA